MNKFILPIFALAILGMVACSDQKKGTDEKDSKEQTTEAGEQENGEGSLIADAVSEFLGEKSPVDAAVALIEEATEKMEQAESIEEIETIGEEMEAKADALEEKFGDLDEKDFTAAEKKKIVDAMAKFQEVAQKKAVEVAGKQLGGYSE